MPSPCRRGHSTREIVDELRAILRSIQTGSGRHSAPKSVPSVAVLPFKDLSPAADQQYFCEGMADEIITALSGVGGIQVASRSSSVPAQEKGLDAVEIGQRLTVQHLVEGSVCKAGNRVRITAQLTNIADGYQLWTERYDRDLDDVFAVQDEIARTIVERLKVKLTPADEVPAIRKATDSAEAYALYTKGRYHWARRNRWHPRVALECFDKAVALDPDYALAHAGLADCYTIMNVYGVRPGSELRPLALNAAERALFLDASLAEAHHAYGAVCQWVLFDRIAAEASHKRALELNPRLAITYAYLGLLYAVQRRRQEASAAVGQATTLEPDSAVVQYISGGVSYWIGEMEAAERYIAQALELEREAAYPNWIKACMRCRTGAFDAGHRDRGARCRAR